MIVATALMIPWQARSQSVLLADDPFSDGTVMLAGKGDPLGLVWRQEGAALEVVDDQGGLGGGKALQFAPKKDFSRIVANVPAVPLEAASSRRAACGWHAPTRARLSRDA